MMGAPTPPASPWGAAVRRRVVFGHVAALTLGVAGCLSANAQTSLDDQVPWIDVVVLAGLVSAAAQALWLVEGRRSISMLRRQVIERRGSAVATGPQALPVPVEPSSAGALVTVDGGSWHHRPDCLLVRGKVLRPVGARVRTEPCSVCAG